MATRLYVTNSAPGLTPGTIRGSWNFTGGTGVSAMSTTKSGAKTVSSTIENSSSNTATALLRRFVSDEIGAQTISGTVNWVLGVFESDVIANAYFRVHIWVSSPSGGLRGTLLSNFNGSTEFPTLGTGRTEGPQTLSSVTAVAGDRIVAEIGWQGRNTTTTNQQGWLYHGGTGADLVDGASDSSSSENVGWLEFSADLFGGGEPVEEQKAGSDTATLSAEVAQVAEESLLDAADTASLSAETVDVVETLFLDTTDTAVLSAETTDIEETLFFNATDSMSVDDVVTERQFTQTDSVSFVDGAAPTILGVESGGQIDIEIRLISIAGDALTPPVFLPDYLGVALSPVRNSPGAFQFEYPADGLNYSYLRQLVDDDLDAVVEFWLDGTSQYAMRGYILESDGDDVAEVGTRTFSGSFLEYRMNEYQLPYSPDVLSENGEWFFSAKPGSIVGSLMDYAQSEGFLTDITYATFGTDLDSNGVPWEFQGNLSISPGSSFMDIFNNLVEIGMMEWEITAAHELKVYNPGGRGQDRTLDTPPLELRAGKHVMAAPRKHTVRGAATDVLAAGKEGFYRRAADATAAARRGRKIQTYVSNGNIDDPAALVTYADTKLQELVNGTTEVTHQLTFGTSDPVPILNYNIGDWVYSDVRPNQSRERMRIVQWSLNQDENGRITGNVVLNDMIDERTVKIARKLDAIQKGFLVVGTSQTGEDTSIPKAPTDLSALSDAYIVDGRVQSTVTLSWADVTENVDGTAITDLSGYRIRWRYRYVLTGASGESPQQFFGNFGTIGGLAPLQEMYFSVAAVDRHDHQSEWSTELLVTTANDAIAPPVPSTPVVEDRLGVIHVSWDGLGSFGEAMPTDFSHLEAHVSTSAVFTPDASTLFSSMLRAKGVIIYDQAIIGTTYYFRLIAVDNAGNKSDPSGTSSAVTESVADSLDILIEAAQLADGAVTTPKIFPEAVITSHLSVAAFSDDLVPNGGFEDPVIAGTETIPAEWVIGGFANTTGTAQRVTNEARSGKASFSVTLNATTGYHDMFTTWIPATPGEAWYLELHARSSRSLSALRLISQFSVDGSTPLATAYFASNTFSTTTAWNTTAFTGQYSIPLTTDSVTPKYVRFIIRSGSTGDASSATFWYDDFRARKVVGRANIANAAIGNAQIDTLAVQNANVADLNVGKLTAGTFTAAMTLSGSIRTATSGARVEIDATGIRAYNSSNVNTVNLSATTGTATVTGTMQTGVSGRRLTLDGSANEMRFYPTSDNTRFGRLWSYTPDPENFGNTVAIELRSQGLEGGTMFARHYILPDQQRMFIHPTSSETVATADIRMSTGFIQLSASDGVTSPRRADLTLSQFNGNSFLESYNESGLATRLLVTNVGGYLEARSNGGSTIDGGYIRLERGTGQVLYGRQQTSFHNFYQFTSNDATLEQGRITAFQGSDTPFWLHLYQKGAGVTFSQWTFGAVSFPRVWFVDVEGVADGDGAMYSPTTTSYNVAYSSNLHSGSWWIHVLSIGQVGTG